MRRFIVHQFGTRSVPPIVNAAHRRVPSRGFIITSTATAMCASSILGGTTLATVGYIAADKLANRSLAKAKKENGHWHDEEFYFRLQMAKTMGGWLLGSLSAIYAVEYLSEDDGMRRLLLLNKFEVLKEEFEIANQYAALKRNLPSDHQLIKDQQKAFLGLVMARYKKLAEDRAIDEVLTKKETIERAIQDYQVLSAKLHASLAFLHEQAALKPQGGIPHSVECEHNKQVIVERIRSVSSCLSLLAHVERNSLL